MPFPVLQSLFDPLLPPGLQWYWRADFVKEFTSEAIAKHFEHACRTPAGLSQVHIYPIDGAAHGVGKGDTAFSYRDANFAVVIVGIDADPAKKGEITKWCKDYFDALHPYSAGGAYVNFMMEEGQERVESSFRENYARLALIKAKYDPTNLFRVNQNIRPAAAAL
jgi:FAD/FMN-containing dehydrogenase